MHKVIKYLLLVSFSILVGFFYYTRSGINYNFDGYLWYILLLLMCYWVYKTLTCSHKNKKKISFSSFDIAWFFFLHLFILCIFFFVFNGDEVLWSVLHGGVLFSKIIFYAGFPAILFLVTTSFWTTVLEKCLWNIFICRSLWYKFIFSYVFGFFTFMFSLSSFGLSWMYNTVSLFWIIITLGFLGRKNILVHLKNAWSKTYTFDNHDFSANNLYVKIAPKLIFTEFLFIVLTLFLSVNLISIVRPFPIGWDELWVYMTYAKMIAEIWSISELWWMISWQVFTWIGYLFDSPVLAFVLNNVWGFSSIILIIAILGHVFKDRKETMLPLTTLWATLFFTMPMIIFQQAKDMKLDPGLFFVSIAVLYLLYDFYLQKDKDSKEKNNNTKKYNIKFFLIIGMLLGFSFSIKFTSLLLISAVFWVLFYTRLWILWFLWYISMYIAIFTGLWLWGFLNILIPESATMYIVIISLIIGVSWIYVWAMNFSHQYYTKFFSRMLALLAWILIAISPWLVSNIATSGGISIDNILNWKASSYPVDYSKIYSKEELVTIDNTEYSRLVDETWTTQNADFGRYFWYEKWINNYIKIPFNLTFQRNQSWEFTDIGYLFLVFLPALLLFLPFKNNAYYGIIYLLIFLEIIIFFIPWTRDLFTTFFSRINLPWWYLVLLGSWIWVSVFMLKGLKNKSLINLFKLNITFSLIYVLLWLISAFGIVWYWIVMYFNMILMILIALYYATAYKKGEECVDPSKIWGSCIIFGIICVYLFWSSFPYAFTNLKSGGFSEFKKGTQTLSEAPFLYHPTYLVMLYEMNIANEKKKTFMRDQVTDPILLKVLEENNAQQSIQRMKEVLTHVVNDAKAWKELQKRAQATLQWIYKTLLSPPQESINTEGIYRIWTFLKYHIANNNTRLLEDSLVESFTKYMYHENSDVTVERIKKLWLKHLLVDLNAATIDEDPNHELTARYELLLKTFVSKKLTLASTDSACLELALDEYQRDRNLNKFMELAGSNFTSYKEDGTQNTKIDKRIKCYTRIITLIDGWKVTNTSYPYLRKFIPYLEKYSNNQQKAIFLDRSAKAYGFKALFKVD